MSRAAIVGTVVVIAAAAGGFFLQRSLAERRTLTPDESASSAVPISAGAAQGKQPPAAANSPAEGSADQEDDLPRGRPIPETLPDITLPDQTGRPRKLNEWTGRPVVVNFWATWCGPCRQEIPLLKQLVTERKADRLEVIGIAIDSVDEVRRFTRDMGIRYPVLIGEKEGYAAAEAFGVSLVLPFSVFADQKGRIVTLKIGELHAEEASFILDRVRDVDAKRLELTDARRQIADKLRDFAVERGRKAAASG